MSLMKDMLIRLLFLIMNVRPERNIRLFLNQNLMLVFLIPLMWVHCTKEQLRPDALYADPLTVALRFADDAANIQHSLKAGQGLKLAFGDISPAALEWQQNDTIELNGIAQIRSLYLWKDTLRGYRTGNINYPGMFQLTQMTGNELQLDFVGRFYRKDSINIYYINANLILSSATAGFVSVSGQVNVTTSSGKIFQIKLDFRRQNDQGLNTLVMTDDRWLMEGTGMIDGEGRSLRFANLSPLIRVTSTNCDFQAGELGLSAEGWPAQILSYGNGGCDRIYYLSENSNQEEHTLP
jgi:hypothetical protein